MVRLLFTLRFARALVLTNLKAATALRGAFLLKVAFMMLNNVVFFVFWYVLFAKVPSIRGWRIGDMELLFGISATSFGLVQGFAGGVTHLGRLIDDGELDSLLTQPKPILLYALGSRSQPSGFGDSISGVGFLLASGYLSWSRAPVILLAVAAASITFVACGTIFFSVAFWVPRSATLSRQLWELLVTFSLYPESIFGGPLRLVLFTVFPAAFVGFLPVRVVREPTWANVALLGAGALVHLVVALVTFDRGRRRYSSGSRFSTVGSA
jgi:ABC-2 type transport system permease protein